MKIETNIHRTGITRLPISTFIYLCAIYIFPRSICLFCCRKYVDWSLGIYKSLTDTWLRKMELRSRNFQKRNTEMEFPWQCTVLGHPFSNSVVGQLICNLYNPQRKISLFKKIICTNFMTSFSFVGTILTNKRNPTVNRSGTSMLRRQRMLKGTVSRDFRLLVFFMNQFPPSPWV